MKNEINSARSRNSYFYWKLCPYIIFSFQHLPAILTTTHALNGNTPVKPASYPPTIQVTTKDEVQRLHSRPPKLLARNSASEIECFGNTVIVKVPTEETLLFLVDLKGRSPLASAAIATLASIIFPWKKDYVMRALGKKVECTGWVKKNATWILLLNSLDVSNV